MDFDASSDAKSRRQRRLQQQHDEIELLQRAKQREIDMTGDPEWREKLRRELEAEINRRVREALDTPPAERQRRSRELARIKASEQRERELNQLRSAAAFAGSVGAYHRFGADDQHQSGFRRAAVGSTDDFFYSYEASTVAPASSADADCAKAVQPSANRLVRFQDSCDRFRHQRRVRRLLDGDVDDSVEDVDNDWTGGDDESSRQQQQQQQSLPLIPGSRQLTRVALWTTPQHQQPQRISSEPTASSASAGTGTSIQPPLRQGLEAMRQFGDLSQEERLLLFRNFTRDGFRQAFSGLGGVAASTVGSFVGRLPDGSVLTRQADGRFRDQYGLVRKQHGPFWPRDFGPCHPAPRHRRLPSPEHEPLLLPSRNLGCEPLLTVDTQTTQYTGRWRGVQIVYDSERCPRHYTPMPVSDGLSPSLVFESRFESGNLRQVRRVGMFEYELVLRTDLYTKRHTQWFYFRVQNAQPRIVYKFVILNLLKSTSLYGEGMKPLLYSEKCAANENLGWHRSGHHIRYSRNVTRLQSTLLHREMVYYQLEWQMEFPYAEDSCYLAHSYPYTYTDLRADLIALQEDQSRCRFVKEEVLCHTRAGNSCFLLTITDDTDSPGNNSKKPGIVVTARVHPGEANSSWMMKGLIDFLTGDSPTAHSLRKHFVFKLVPMLNPDGVIVGNYRTSLAARDLNRNYRHPRPEAFPTVYHTKKMLEKLHQERQVLLYCDLHGHSRKSNVFMYGCDSQYRDVDADQVNSVRLRVNPESFLKERLFPWLMSRCSPQLFSYRGCKFNIRKCKEATGRVVMWRQFGIENSFTMEATFSGTSTSVSDCRHFNTNDLESMGHSLACALWQYKLVKEDSMRQCTLVVDMTFDLLLGLLGNSELNTDSTASSISESKGAADEACGPNNNYRASLLDALRAAIGGSKTNAATAAAKKSIAQWNPSSLRDQLGLKSMDDCGSVIRQLNIINVDESDSSDSDSESEPEMPLPPQEPVNKKRKRKTKKKDSGINGGGGGGRKREVKDVEPSTQRRKTQHPRSLINNCRVSVATVVTQKNSVEVRQSLQTGDNESNGVTAEEQAPSEQNKANGSKQAIEDTGNSSARVKIKQYPMFVSKFEGRTNNGIPCFSEERLLERANRKIYSLHSRLNQERGHDIIYSRIDEIPSELNPHLASLEEIRHRLQSLLTSQNDAAAQQDELDNSSDSDDTQQQRQKQQTHQQLQKQPATNQNFAVVRPVQSLRPAKVLQRRRSLSHFGRSVGHPGLAGATTSPPSLDRSLPTQLILQRQYYQQQQQQQAGDAVIGLSQPESAAAASTASTNRSRARVHRLPQLRERHN